MIINFQISSSFISFKHKLSLKYSSILGKSVFLSDFLYLPHFIFFFFPQILSSWICILEDYVRRYGLKIISASDFYNDQAKIIYLEVFLLSWAIFLYKNERLKNIKFSLTKRVGIVDIVKTRLRKALGLVGN